VCVWLQSTQNYFLIKVCFFTKSQYDPVLYEEDVYRVQGLFEQLGTFCLRTVWNSASHKNMFSDVSEVEHI
jgi:hypothetical protein